jgi:GDP-4-dehydro-6-deoxy-D-mannose reductase
MKTIFVTGISGFVGQHLLSLILNQSNYTVIGFGRSDFNFKHPNFKYIKGDLNQKSTLKNINFKEVDQIIHLAALSSVGNSFRQIKKYLDNNTNSQMNLFETCLIQKVRPKFLIVSSAAIYDTDNQLPLVESSSIKARSPYALSKIFQEELSKYYHGLGFEITIARPFNHIGPDQSSGFLIPDLIEQISKFKKDEHKELVVGNLSTKRDYTDVRDVVRAYLDLIKIKNINNFEIFNICSCQAYSGQEILDKIIKISNLTNYSIKTNHKLLRVNDVSCSYGSYQKIHQKTKWAPKISLDQSLKDILKNKMLYND